MGVLVCVCVLLSLAHIDVSLGGKVSLSLILRNLISTAIELIINKEYISVF